MGNHIVKGKKVDVPNIYDYECIYEYSTLTDEEKDKVLTLVKSCIEKCSNNSEYSWFGGKSIYIPKYLLVSPSRYFNIGSAFTNMYKNEEKWHCKCNRRFNTPKKVDNSEFYSIIEEEIIKNNKDYNFSLDVNMEGSFIGYTYKYCLEYENDDDKNKYIYGRLPEYYMNYKNLYGIIKISVNKVFSVKD